jgi:hypothetical protein
MKRRLALALGLVLLAGSVAADAARPRPLAAGESLRGRFTQERHLQGFSAPLKSEGSFVLVPGQGLIWRGEKPFETTTVITPAGILQMAGGVETARLSAARAPFLARFYDMLSGALAGDWHGFERDFTVTTHADDKQWTMTLEPRRPDVASTAQMEALAVTGTAFVDAVEIRKPGGDWDRLTFLDQAVSREPLPQGDAALFATAAK